MSEKETKKDISNMALFVDFEGMNAKRLQTWVEQLSTEGRISMKRAYADWSKQNSDTIGKLMQASIELIQVSHYPGRSKNGADIRLAVDAMEVAFRYPYIDKFIIFAGDSDYLALVIKLREQNRLVHLIGPRNSTSEVLIKYCDKFGYISDIDPQDPEDVREIKDTLIRDKENAIALIQRSLETFQNRGIAFPIRDSAIKDTMKRLDPSFDERRLGYSSFRKFLEVVELEGYIKTEIDPENRNCYVSPLEASLSQSEPEQESSTMSIVEMPQQQGQTEADCRTILLLLHALYHNRDYAGYSELIENGQELHKKQIIHTHPTQVVRELIHRDWVETFEHPSNPHHKMVRMTADGQQQIQPANVSFDWYWSVRYRKVISELDLPLKVEHTVSCWQMIMQSASPLTFTEAIQQVKAGGNIREDRVPDHFRLLEQAGIIERQADDVLSVKFLNKTEVWNTIVQFLYNTVVQRTKYALVTAFADIIQNFRHEDADAPFLLGAAIQSLTK